VYGAGQYIHCAAANISACARVYWTVVFPHPISALLSYPAPSVSGPHFAMPAKMLNLLAARSLPQAAAVIALVAVLGVVVRRRYFSPISDVPRPF
jgi:hypothetical protein